MISVAVFRGNGRSVHCYIGVSEQNVSLKGQRYSRGLSIVTARKRCFKTSM